MTQQNNAAPNAGAKILHRRKQLLDDRRVRMLMAAFLAVVCWMIVTMVIQPNTDKVVYGVPVNFTYDSAKYTSQGLSIVNNPEYTVSLKVVGNGYVIGDLTKDDFVVYPNYSSVKAGDATLRLKVICTNEAASNLTVTITPASTTVSVRFDTVEEKTVPINVVTKDLHTADGYTLYKTTAAPGEVTLSGPTSELETVTQAIAEVSTTQELNDTVTLTSDLTFADADGNPVQFTYVTPEQDTVDVTLHPFHLAVDLVTFGKPGDISLSVCHVQGLYFRAAHQCRIDGFGFVRLVIEVDAGCRAEPQFVLCRCRFLVFVV